jgi:hypothetical protein
MLLNNVWDTKNPTAKKPSKYFECLIQSTTVVLNFDPQETFGSARRHFGLSHRENTTGISWVEDILKHIGHPHAHTHTHTHTHNPQRIIPLKISSMLRFRNSGLLQEATRLYLFIHRCVINEWFSEYLLSSRHCDSPWRYNRS